MEIKKIILTVFGLFLLIGIASYYADSNMMENSEISDMMGETNEKDHEEEQILTFGPGEAPEWHKDIDFSKLESQKDIVRLSNEIPKPIDRDTSELIKYSLTTKEVVSEIAPGIKFVYWTYDEKLPGPFLRVREGDTIELKLTNDKTSTHNHSIDLHAVTGPGGGAVLTQVKPGESKTITFKALNPGLYVYHCATPNVPKHVANGMYGLILVEPKGGLEKEDKEFYVMQGELYTTGKLGETGLQGFDPVKMFNENPEYIIFNGRVKSLVDHPAEANVGEKVRIFIGNGGVSKISSFHVIGEIFDKVYVEGSTSPIDNVQTTIVPAGGSSIVEFGLELPGDYVLVDHALSRIDRGAWGLLKVKGEGAKDILK